MSINFAEQILDSMVDESGHCGDRGLSEKQFECLARYLEAGEVEECGGWSGHYRFIPFTFQTFEGNIGKYHVKLSDYYHFHHRYAVVGIDLRPADEVELEARLREIGRFEHSEWQYEPKKRVDLELTLVREHSYERLEYGRYYNPGTETVFIYTLADAEGNCYVWKTTNWLAQQVEDEDGYIEDIMAEPGDTVRLRATVKEHNEWHGIKQTVLTRAKVGEVCKAA